MNCQSVKLVLSEFADERLDASTAWQVQTHLAECDACRQISRDLASVSRMLKTLPPQGPSARFDEMLVQRLALTRRPAAAPLTLRTKFARSFRTQKSLLRPALALGLVLGAGMFAAFFPVPIATTTTQATVARGADHAFVADCVAQHHRDAAAEPLADLSAQTLAGSLDNSADAVPADSSSF